MCTAFICQVIAEEPVQGEKTLNPYGVQTSNPYVVRRFWENGKEIDMVIVPGCPPEVYRAPLATPPEPNIAMGTNTLSNVPAFNWCYGCSATSAAMMMGHYDNTVYANMYAGPTNGGVCPMNNTTWGSGECPLSATHLGYDERAIRGHVDDYWIASGNAGPDPWIGHWTEHTQGDCTGDFMGTNQSSFNNTDGSTTFFFYTNGSPLYDYTGAEPTYRDGCHGLKLFVESRGYSVYHDGSNYQNYSQYIKGQGSNPNLGFTFDDFKAEIDAGRPVLIQVAGHTMLGYGYDDTGEKIYIHDTWDYSDHSMTWGGKYSGLQHYGVTVLHLIASGGDTGAGHSSEACFIATAAYGGYTKQHEISQNSRMRNDTRNYTNDRFTVSPFHPVNILRRFRDERLLTNVPGRTFVSFYNRVSPGVADFIRDKEVLKAIVRFYLKPIVKMVSKIEEVR